MQATTDDGATWDHVWYKMGDQGVGWQVAHVDVAMYVHRVRFVGSTGSSHGAAFLTMQTIFLPIADAGVPLVCCS